MSDFISEDFVKNRVPKLMKGKDELKIRDSKLTGFMLRCRYAADKSITRTFMIDYLSNEKGASGKPKRKWLTIGNWPMFNAEDAREEARVQLKHLKGGDDPKAIRAQKKARATFDELWTLFQKEHLDLKEASTQKDYQGRYRRILEPAFKGRRVADITRAEVHGLRRKHKNNPTDLNRALAVLSKMMSFAILHEMRGDNPCKAVPRFTETANDTWIDETNLAPFVKAIGEIEGAVGDIVRFMAVTGWRVSAARLLRWDQVDLSRLEVHLDDKATKKTATALSSDAAMLIEAQGHRIGYVFSNKRGTLPVDYRGILEALTGACKKAEIERITPHTLRRTIATHAALQGANVSELMQGFGWATPAMAMRYVKKSESLARKSVERAASIINIFDRPSAEVIALHQPTGR